MMTYKGYLGQVEFDDEANIFHGDVINMRDVITFQGESVGELRQAFIDSVDDYLAFCTKRNEKPEKPYSGKLIVRMSPDLHRLAVQQAVKSSKSLNQWVNQAISDKILDSA